MKIYTKIFIGMAVGILVGFILGPQSGLLEPDALVVYDPSTCYLLTTPKGEKISHRFPAGSPARFKILDRRWEGKHLFYQVSTKITERQALTDSTGQLKRGVYVEGWVDSREVPSPISTTGLLVLEILDPLGKIFLRLIMMVIVPLVFSSLLLGIASLGDVRKLGRLGGKTLGYFLLTTAISITIGLTFANIIKPGQFIDPLEKEALIAQYSADASQKSLAASQQPTPIDNLVRIVPTNPIRSMADGDMLPIIFFAIFFGIALTLLPHETSARVVDLADGVNDAMIMCVHLVMKVAPWGVLALVANVVGQSGLSVLKALGVYALVVIIGLLTHGFLVYTTVARVFGKLSPLDFWRAIRPAQLVAFSTSSSSAALPVTMSCAEENLGISNQVSSFVLPLGSTVNMDGTALYQGVAAVFIAQVFNIDLSLGDQINIVFTATLASIGAAGVPGVGMVTLALVLTSIGIPTVGVALILGVDRILDMFRTMINITGDVSAAVLVASSEGEQLAYRENRSRMTSVEVTDFPQVSATNPQGDQNDQ